MIDIDTRISNKLREDFIDLTDCLDICMNLIHADPVRYVKLNRVLSVILRIFLIDNKDSQVLLSRGLNLDEESIFFRKINLESEAIKDLNDSEIGFSIDFCKDASYFVSNIENFYTNDLLNLKEWLNLIIIKGDISTKDIIRYLANKEGAHAALEISPIEKLKSFHSIDSHVWTNTKVRHLIIYGFAYELFRVIQQNISTIRQNLNISQPVEYKYYFLKFDSENHFQKVIVPITNSSLLNFDVIGQVVSEEFPHEVRLGYLVNLAAGCDLPEELSPFMIDRPKRPRRLFLGDE